MGGPASNNPSGLLSLGAPRPFRTNPAEAPTSGKISGYRESFFNGDFASALTSFQKALSHYALVAIACRVKKKEKKCERASLIDAKSDDVTTTTTRRPSALHN